MDSFSIDSRIAQSWHGGYKIVTDFTAKTSLKNWQLYFSFDHKIRAVYGVKLSGSDNHFAITGDGDQDDVCADEKVTAIFIIDSFETPVNIVFKAETTIVAQPTIPTVPPEELPVTPQLSADAIAVSFEDNTNEATYNKAAQSKTFEVDWSQQLDLYARVSNQAASAGNKSLRIKYPAKKQINIGSSWVLPDRKEYYLSYWLLFAQNFDFNGKYDWSSGGKLPGLAADGFCSGGATCNGRNGFTARYMWRENGRIVLYLYHMDKAGKYGDDLELKGNDGKPKHFIKGQWHNLIQRVRINDQNQRNGSLDVWLDKEPVLSKTNLRFVTNGSGVNRVYFSTFHGGNGAEWLPDNDVYAYFDDFVISPNKADMPW